LKTAKEDGELLDLYHGEKIEVKDDGTILAVNIPLDPVIEDRPNKRILWRHALRRAQYGIAIFGPLVSLFAFIVDPQPLTGGLLIFQVLSYLLFLRLAKPRRPKGWGIVYDKKTRFPLNRVIIRIFDKKFNKLLETQVTGPNGTYGFFAKKSTFFLTVEKPGFKDYRSQDIDLSNKEATVIDKHIPLEKVDGK